MRHLYESHLGGYYVTDHKLSLDERYCETYGDADICIGGWTMTRRQPRPH